MKLALLLAFVVSSMATSLFAGDVSGKWIGTLEGNIGNDDGESSHSAYLVFKQDGAKLAGSVGPDSAEQHPFEDGTIDGATLTFTVLTEGPTIKFVLKLDGDSLGGDMTLQHEGKTVTAKLSAKRSAAQ